jgi:hypothetical protein
MPNNGKPKTPSSLLEEAGLAICANAPNWQMTLAHLLGVRRDSVHDWKSGRNPIRPQVWAELLSLITHQKGELHRLEAEVRELLAQQADKP